MKYKIFLLILVIITFFGWTSGVKALEVVDLNPTMQVGEIKNIELYANVPDNTERIEFLLSFLNYDVVGTFESSLESLTINGTAHSISFDEPITGRIKIGAVKIKISDSVSINTSNVNLYNANAVSVDGVKTKLNNQSIQINITKKQDESKINLLKSITSNIVDIPFKSNKYEYDILVNNEIDKLDLTVTAIDETYKIDISDQNIKEGINRIFITVSNGNITEKYTINVTKKQKEETKDDIVEDTNKIKKNEVSKIENKNFKSGWNFVIIGLIVLFIVGLFMLKKR